MSKGNHKSAFTLIEIMVVLIILGVLGVVALPNLFSNVKKSKSAEAIALLNTYKQMNESCIFAHAADGTQASCGPSLLSLLASSKNFTFGYGGSGAAGWSPINGSEDNSDVSYKMVAQGKGVSGFVSADYIALERDTAYNPAVFKCTAGGVFKGVC